jgi:uncharacterized protein YneF (UPF0154 family)
MTEIFVGLTGFIIGFFIASIINKSSDKNSKLSEGNIKSYVKTRYSSKKPTCPPPPPPNREIGGD